MSVPSWKEFQEYFNIGADEGEEVTKETQDMLMFSMAGYMVGVFPLFILANTYSKQQDTLLQMCQSALYIPSCLSLVVLIAYGIDEEMDFGTETIIQFWIIAELCGFLVAGLGHYMSTINTYFLPFGFALHTAFQSYIYAMSPPKEWLGNATGWNTTPPPYLPDGFLTFFLAYDMAIAVYIASQFQADDCWGISQAEKDRLQKEKNETERKADQKYEKEMRQKEKEKREEIENQKKKNENKKKKKKGKKN